MHNVYVYIYMHCLSLVRLNRMSLLSHVEAVFVFVVLYSLYMRQKRPIHETKEAYTQETHSISIQKHYGVALVSRIN